MAQSSSTTSGGVRRQISLPLSKAVEIAYKSIRMRLSRSLLVTSGIILALAFLMSIQTSDVLISGMRNWITTTEASVQYKSLIEQRKVLQGSDNPADAARLKLINHQISEPENLRALMKSKGVSIDEAQVHSAEVQTRWLLGLALLVAFVGILNAMLMSVTERFREIGTMKCLGALDGFIIKLFLIESLFQGFVGTVIGIAIGLGLSILAATATYGDYIWRNASVSLLLINIGFCLLVGVVLTVGGAVYPAWQAARMQPIDAMRVET